jgi:hypothetical protein
MIVGCYTLDLYCDNLNIPEGAVTDGIHDYKEFPKTFIHEYGSVCRKIARAKGWKFTRDGRALCPKCSGRKK